jgi:hypothetical protein
LALIYSEPVPRLAFFYIVNSLKRRGGRDIKQDVAKPPFKERTGWSDRRKLSGLKIVAN